MSTMPSQKRKERNLNPIFENDIKALKSEPLNVLYFHDSFRAASRESAGECYCKHCGKVKEESPNYENNISLPKIHTKKKLVLKKKPNYKCYHHRSILPCKFTQTSQSVFSNNSGIILHNPKVTFNYDNFEEFFDNKEQSTAVLVKCNEIPNLLQHINIMSSNDEVQIEKTSTASSLKIKSCSEVPTLCSSVTNSYKSTVLDAQKSLASTYKNNVPETPHTSSIGSVNYNLKNISHFSMAENKSISEHSILEKRENILKELHAECEYMKGLLYKKHMTCDMENKWHKCPRMNLQCAKYASPLMKNNPFRTID